MRKKILIAVSTLILASCQTAGSPERALSPTTTNNDATSSGPADVRSIVSGNTFRSGAQRVTFGQDGTYRYSRNGFSVFARWSGNADQICLQFDKKRCSKFKQKSSGRYGWSFNGRTESSYEKVDGPVVSSVKPVLDGDSISPRNETIAFLQSKVHRLPNGWTVGMNSAQKIQFKSRRRSSAATLRVNNGKLCGNLRIGTTTCFSVVVNGDRRYLLSEIQNQPVTRRWIILNN